MGFWFFIAIVVIAIAAMVIVGVSVNAWASVERVKKVNGSSRAFDEYINELREETTAIKAELTVIREYLASVHKMMSDVQ